jgi:hypothetical protein
MLCDGAKHEPWREESSFLGDVVCVSAYGIADHRFESPQGCKNFSVTVTGRLSVTFRLIYTGDILGIHCLALQLFWFSIYFFFLWLVVISPWKNAQNFEPIFSVDTVYRGGICQVTPDSGWFRGHSRTGFLRTARPGSCSSAWSRGSAPTRPSRTPSGGSWRSKWWGRGSGVKFETMS